MRLKSVYLRGNRAAQIWQHWAEPMLGSCSSTKQQVTVRNQMRRLKRRKRTVSVEVVKARFVHHVHMMNENNFVTYDKIVFIFQFARSLMDGRILALRIRAETGKEAFESLFRDAAWVAQIFPAEQVVRLLGSTRAVGRGFVAQFLEKNGEDEGDGVEPESLTPEATEFVSYLHEADRRELAFSRERQRRKLLARIAKEEAAAQQHRTRQDYLDSPAGKLVSTLLKIRDWIDNVQGLWGARLLQLEKEGFSIEVVENYLLIARRTEKSGVRILVHNGYQETAITVPHKDFRPTREFFSQFI